MSVLNLKNQKPSQSKSRSGISGKHLDTVQNDKRGWFREWWSEWNVFIICTSLMLAFLLLLIWVIVRPIPKTDAFDNPNRFRIEAGGSSVGVALVTDRDTGVQYLMNTHSGTFTVLIDKDGKPYLANGWRDYD